MIHSNVVDMIKDGDGVYVPKPLALLPGPRELLALPKPDNQHKLIVLEDFREKRYPSEQAAAFKRTMQPLPDYIDFSNGRVLPKPKPKRDEPVNDIKAWLILSTLAERRGTDTAISAALQGACLKKLPAIGEKPWPVIRHLFKSDSPKPKKTKRLDTDHVKAPTYLTTPPISKPLSWKLYKDGWYLMNDGGFMKPGLCKEIGGFVHSIHLGGSVKKTPSYMNAIEQKRYDDYIKGEVSCG